MPRLLPRLLESLKARPIDALEQSRPLRHPAKGRKSLRQLLPPAPRFAPEGRSHSILLDAVNPVSRPQAYVRHKTLPPSVRLHRSQRKNTVSRDGTVELDRRRKMTAVERDWWANPYLRMLSGPLRKCALTLRYLPRDFMIRVTPRRIPTSRTARKELYALLPDGLEHSKYKNLHLRKGTYIVCREAAIEELSRRGRYQRIIPNLTLPPMLPQYIDHILRLRVIQELEILVDQLQTRPQNSKDAPLLRRLTRAEFTLLCERHVLPDRDALAVLVVPPPNKDPVTKQRPAPNTSPLPEPISTLPGTQEARPASVIYSLVDESSDGLPNVISSAKVPLYNGVSLFPSKTQRAALHERLCRLLFVERRARYREHGRPMRSYVRSDVDRRNKWARSEQKGSHAFLLTSSAETVKRADSVPLAIALWRLRMWKGDSWEKGSGAWASLV
ncbi:hypothetical protein BV25DRAFT_1817850 [Artomyces pyxidatus]|uniref:Uncharacterized protein n=1 Tax=Artomyces pyxidatus TaxID=48021 RepID=A0ACB8TKG4_9AGAM|nr:hypothetical protein BV25DRAFT_1817850 [Artomyces pyxidatus]